MPKSTKSRAAAHPSRKAAVPWWLTAEEICPHCEQGYAYEMELRCVECDDAICPLCAIGGRVVCPQCAPAGRK